MALIEQILRQAINPFDSVNFRPGNFWQETQDRALTVDSIHREAIDRLAECLAWVEGDRRTRTILLCGDSGAGKSHLLDRLKQHFNDRAFFAYIGPWPDREFLWRHILRNTVDSLLKVPDGQQESQLLIWLKSFSIFQQRSLLDRLLGDRKAFIRKLRETYPSDLYNANEFLGVLYDLLDPEFFWLASDWLRGENLDDEDLKTLRVRQPIETEDAAQKVLANFGRISADTQPIVLCFDNLDCIAGTPEGTVNLQSLLNCNSTIHNEKLKNFLIIISLITDTAYNYVDRLQPSDLARIDSQIVLKPIRLSQVEELYAARLHPLHQQANPQPSSPIFPLTRQLLDCYFPGQKTNPRNALELGRKVIFEYKTGKAIESEDILPAFKLVWLQALQKTEKRVTRIRQFSSVELMQMLYKVGKALQIDRLATKFLPNPRYTHYSLSYENGDGKIGIVWMEDPNLTSFFYLMKACEDARDRSLCCGLKLVRSERLGVQENKGYKLYQTLFDRHSHLSPSLESIGYLVTYQNLFHAAGVGELVVGNRTPDIDSLERLTRESKVLFHCPLLQDLGWVRGDSIVSLEDRLLDFLIDLIATQQLIGRQVLIEKAMERFTELDAIEIDRAIDRMSGEARIQILDPTADQHSQLICFEKELKF
ncbi:MAG: ATP-binding protein [Cyanobacteria bacterium J055]|nr:MAG: ATP-binding protein [Cyanobacteria bacterium J055]